METAAIYTVVKMMEALPESTQDRVVDLVREYLADLEDEAEWDELFATTQSQLQGFARQARREIEEGKAELMDYDHL
ncbi:MAG: hypothetical protein KA586_00015 [Candidatus Promineofilum sp.]|nr:hypothetical protein [Promineifilum sp.]